MKALLRQEVVVYRGLNAFGEAVKERLPAGTLVEYEDDGTSVAIESTLEGDGFLFSSDLKDEYLEIP